MQKIQDDEILDYLFSLPDDPEDSEAEADYLEEDNASPAESSRSGMPHEEVSENPTVAGSSDISQLTTNTDSGNANVFPDIFDDENAEHNASVMNTEEVGDRDVSDSDSEWGDDTTCLENTVILCKEPKSKVDFSVTDSECVYFEKLFCKNIMEHICLQTNLYAAQKNSVNWKEITVPELKAFIGMLIIMGIHQLPAADNYWSSDPMLKVNSVSNVMTLSQYKKIVQNLHCNDNSVILPPKTDPNYDKLYKIRPIIAALNKNCLAVYEPSSTLAVDESMVAFKGRTSLKQYMPMKPIKRGYKIWCLADSKNGFISNFEVYTGKSSTPIQDFNNYQMCERVVLELCQPFFSTGRIIVFDNFFTTYKLMKGLRNHGLYSCGTVRGNRKGLPVILANKKSDLKRGEFQFAVKCGVAAVRWQDNKIVCLLSTYNNPKDVNFIERKLKDGSKVTIACPEVVRHYNNTMGGVDRFDQLRERYLIGRRSIKWWHRLFYFFVDLAIINSYVLYQTQRQKTDQLTFRLRLARQLINGYSSRKKRGSVPTFFPAKRGVSSVPDVVRLVDVGKHVPKDSVTRKRCRFCSTNTKEKRTKVVCSACGVPLCATPCFSKFHGM